MPREMPELVGEPLGFDQCDFALPDGRSANIERAINITDLCPRLAPNMRVLLCFTTSQKYGLCVIPVESERREGEEHVRIIHHALPCSSLRETIACHPWFQHLLEADYGLPLEQFFQLVEKARETRKPAPT